MKAGYLVTFKLENKIVSETVVRLIVDPLGRHETKVWITHDNENFGIPYSEIISVKKTGFQFDLFQ